MKKQIRKGLGQLEGALLSRLSAELRDEVFTFSEAKEVLGISNRKLSNLLYRLAESRWLEHIERGRYIFLPLEAGPEADYATNPLIIARKLISPYYIGFATALNYHGMTEQVSRITYIAGVKPKKAMKFHEEEYKFVKLAKKRFFGFRDEWLGNMKFNLSDKEKTVIDCLFMPEYCGGITEAVKAFKGELDYGKLYDYSLRMEDVGVLKRLGYILDALEIGHETEAKLSEKVGGGFALLDPSGRKNGNINRKWRIIENLSIGDLKAEL
jgi:predicted transcriptional regulator of viral defense system